MFTSRRTSPVQRVRTAALAAAIIAPLALIGATAASAASVDVGAPITMASMNVSTDAAFVASTKVRCIDGRLEGTVTVSNTGAAPGRFQARSPEGMVIGDFPLVPGFDGVGAFSPDETPWLTVTNRANPSKSMTFGPWDAKAICAPSAAARQNLPTNVLVDAVSVELAPAVVIEKSPTQAATTPLSRTNTAKRTPKTNPRKK